MEMVARVLAALLMVSAVYEGEISDPPTYHYGRRDSASGFSAAISISRKHPIKPGEFFLVQLAVRNDNSDMRTVYVDCAPPVVVVFDSKGKTVAFESIALMILHQTNSPATMYPQDMFPTQVGYSAGAPGSYTAVGHVSVCDEQHRPLAIVSSAEIHFEVVP